MICAILDITSFSLISEPLGHNKSVACLDHIYFLNTKEYSRPKNPIYINMVRDPLQRLVSWYYYIRSTEKLLDNRSWHERHYAPLQGKAPKVEPEIKILKTRFEDCVRNNLNECIFSTGKNSHLNVEQCFVYK